MVWRLGRVGSDSVSSETIPSHESLDLTQRRRTQQGIRVDSVDSRTNQPEYGAMTGLWQWRRWWWRRWWRVVMMMAVIAVMAVMMKRLTVLVEANEVVLWYRIQSIMLHKIQILEVDQGVRNSVGIWIDWLIWVLAMIIRVDMITIHMIIIVLKVIYRGWVWHQANILALIILALVNILLVALNIELLGSMTIELILHNPTSILFWCRIL